MSSSPPKYKSQRIKKPSLRQTQCDPLFQVLLSKKRKNSTKKGLLNKPIKKKKVHIDSIKPSDLKKKGKASLKAIPKVPVKKLDEVRVERRGRKRKEEGKKVERQIREERKEDAVMVKEEEGKLKEGGKRKEEVVKMTEEGEKRREVGEKKEEEIKKEEVLKTKEGGKKEKGRRRKVSKRKEEIVKRKEEGKKEDGWKRKVEVKKEEGEMKEEGKVKIERRGRKKNIDKLQNTVPNIKSKSQDTVVKVIIVNEEMEEVGRRENLGGQKEHADKKEKKKREEEVAWRKEEIRKRREEMKRKKEEYENLRKEERRRRKEEESRRREEERKRRKEKLNIIEESILIVEDEEPQVVEWIKEEDGRVREDVVLRKEREEWLGSRRDVIRKEGGGRKEEGKKAEGGGKREEKKRMEGFGTKDCGVKLIDKKSKKISKTQKSLLKLKAILDKPKKLCNVNELEGRKNKKKELFEKLREIHEQFGEKVNKMEEPKKKISHWDFLLKEMTEVSEFFQKRRKYFLFIGKKLIKLAQMIQKNQNTVIDQKKKEEERNLMKISETMSKMVLRDFWKNISRMVDYNEQLLQENEIKQSQQQKLESLVNKQLQLSNKMADFLHNTSTLSEEASKEEGLLDYDKLNKRFFIEMKKTSDNLYILEDIVIREEDISEKKHTIEEITETAKHLQPVGNTLNSNMMNIKQPFLLKFKLREYQLIGMNWLFTLSQKKMNGILADEMGLGKTIQTIALLASLACDKGIWGPHLIVVPTSILINWEIEFKRWCPSFKIMSYFGSPKERKAKRQGWSRINSFHVCITSYKIAIQDHKIFRRKRWYYLILDEAQHIKNFKSQTWQTLLYFHSQNRLLLTGTPLQNDICELWSLMHFLMPQIFDSHADFKEWFSIPMQMALEKNLPISKDIISQLHSILRPFLLRRLKRDVEKQLPRKTEYLIKCQLSRRQRYLYDEFINRENRKKKIKSEDFLGLMNILMQLRKVCNHPDLHEPRLIESPLFIMAIHYEVHERIVMGEWKLDKIPLEMRIIDHTREEMQDMSNYHYIFPTELARKKMVKVIEKRKEENHNKLYKKWFNYEMDEQTKRINRNFNISKKKLNFPHPLLSPSLLSLLNFHLEERESALVQDFDAVFEQSKYLLNEFLFSVQKVLAYSDFMTLSRYTCQYEKEKQNFENLKPILSSILSPFNFCLVRMRLCFPNKKIAVFDSGKLHIMMELLKKLKSEGHKIIIFTQMSKMLDIFELALNIYNFTYVRLDGSTKPENRQKVVEKFNNDPKVFCFVSSTRSGGIGLNLTGADVVIFYDTDWNPAMDKQAQDRCHRIGQTKNVKIYRLISEFTIEENILLKSVQKSKLDTFIMEEGKFNTDFINPNQKMNVRELLGNIIEGDLDTYNDINYKEYEEALERIEDPEDAMACKRAELEEKNFDIEEIDDFINLNQNAQIEQEKRFLIDFENLPRIYKYGLKHMEEMANSVK